MDDTIKLSNLKGYELELARLCDHDGDEVLTDTEDYQEASIFTKAKEDIQKTNSCTINENIYTKVGNYIQKIFSKEALNELVKSIKDRNTLKTETLFVATSSIPDLKIIDTTKIQTQIITECDRRKLNCNKIDVDYWSTLINDISEEYNIPSEVLVAIVAREVRFVKQQHGGGAMQLTPIAIKDIFPSSSNEWAKVYELLDEKLYNDIVYKTDENGDKKLLHSDVSSMRNQCSNDDSYSLKIGTLLLKMLYIKAVAKKKYGKANIETVKNTILEIRDENLKLTEDEEVECLSNAIQKYNNNTKYVVNGVKLCVDYRKDVIDSLKTQKYDFNNIQMVSS